MGKPLVVAAALGCRPSRRRAPRRHPLVSRSAVLACCALAASLAGPAGAEGPLLQPLGNGPVPAAPWHVAGLPGQTKPFTHFEVVELEGKRVLRVEAESSYGNLVHALTLDPPPSTLQFAWRWRVDQPVEGADLRQRATEDIPAKVCVFFDEPMSQVPFLERQVLRMARVRSQDWLPSATVCYVWDNKLPVGTVLRSPYTGRVRYLVLQSGAEHLRSWRSEKREVIADFLRLYGDEATQAPPIIGVGVGADADNTHGHSIANVADLVLTP
jgi:hypothetical protein